MNIVRAISSFVRPADVTQYAAGDLVANNTTAGSVTPLSFVSPKGGPCYIKSVSLYHTDQDATASTFRVWFLSSSPVVSNGDNGALAGIDAATVLGTVAITADQNCGDTFGISAAPIGLAVSGTVYALIEATGTYTPASAETFGVAVVFDRQ